MRLGSHLCCMAHSGKRSNRRTSQAQLTTQFTTIVGMSLTLFLMALIGLGWLFGHHATVQLAAGARPGVPQRDGANAVETARLAVASDPAVAAASTSTPKKPRRNWRRSSASRSWRSRLRALPPVIDVKSCLQAHAEALAETPRFDACWRRRRGVARRLSSTSNHQPAGLPCSWWPSSLMVAMACSTTPFV